MRRYLCLATFFCLCGLAAHAQSAIFLFDDFYNAKIHFKNRGVTVAKMNYDSTHDKMFYKDKNVTMELMNAAAIDSIVWSKTRTFVYKDRKYLEKCDVPNGTVFIHWKIKSTQIGAVGALGMRTLAKVENIDKKEYGIYNDNEKQATVELYKKKNENAYYFTKDGKTSKVTNLKSLLKLYPGKEEQIEQFVKEHKIDMKEPEDVLALLNFCMGF